MQPSSQIRANSYGHRPLGVAVLACLHWLVAAFILLVIAFWLFKPTMATILPRNNAVLLVLAFGVASFIVLLNLWVGIGLWHRKQGAYQVVLLLNGIAIVGQLVSYAQGASAIPYSIIVNLIIIGYLLRSRIRATFTA